MIELAWKFILIATVVWNVYDIERLQDRVTELEKAVAPVEFESLDDVMYNLGDK